MILKKSVSWSIGSMLAVGAVAVVAQTPPATPLPPAAPATQPASLIAIEPASPGSILSARIGSGEKGDGTSELAAPFESLSGGISLRPPLGWKPARDLTKGEIIQFRSATAKGHEHEAWVLSIYRQTFPQPLDLVTLKDANGREQYGLLDKIMQPLKDEYYGSFELLRKGLSNLGNHDVGLLFYRYSKGGERFFVQRAFVQANDQLYYYVTLTSPGRTEKQELGPKLPPVTGGPDPSEMKAAELFRAVLDSVKLLDRDKIRKEQEDRLIRSRTFLTNLTERKLVGTVIPKQWRRVLKIVDVERESLMDIGYQYIEESTDRKAGQDGIKIGIRTRISPEGKGKPFPREDSESWMFTTMDRKHEDWTKQTAIDDGVPHTASHPWKKVVEFGSTDLKTTRVFTGDTDKSKFQFGVLGDPKQPWTGVKDDYRLAVQYIGSRGDTTPIDRPLPPFYLSQSLTMMLPRLVPPNEQKSYMFATYISDASEVMLQYVDVGPEKDYKLAGRTIRAIPVSERIGLEGAVTTHYIDSRGNWLGSVNKVTRLLILPTDERTLNDLWQDANLTRPGEAGELPKAGPVQPQNIVPMVNPILPK